MNKKKARVTMIKNDKKMMLPKIRFNSDWFQCSSCGYEVQMLVRGDVATCSQCGGTMYRK